jgi:hypothetical protein
MEPAVVKQFREAQMAKARIDAALALHRPGPDGFCTECAYLRDMSRPTHERNALVWLAAKWPTVVKILVILLAYLLLASTIGCGGGTTGPSECKAPTAKERLAEDLAHCYAEYHGVGPLDIIWHDENRDDGGCAWAWNLDNNLDLSRECLNQQTANIDIAWIVAHEICHKKGFPDDYNEEGSTLRFCINVTLSQSGCNY